jgi:hypothetical protein
VTRSRRGEGALVGDRDGDGGDAAPGGALATGADPATAGGATAATEGQPAGASSTEDRPEVEGDPGRPSGRGERLAGVAVAVALGLPIVIAAIAVRTPRWYPQVDLAQIEMRVRDVFSSDPPTIGLGGRIYGINNTQGAHPGPLSFYLLAPVYRLLGGTPWAMQMSDALLNVAALIGTLWATSRRWGLRGVLLIAAALAVLVHLYGTQLLVYPWNPYMPVLFWVLFLVCVWGVLCGDLPLLPVAVVTGTLCAQTHIPYVGLVGGLVIVLVVFLVRRYRRAKGDDTARRRLRRWAGGSALLGAFLWSPVLIQQFGGNPGNISIIWDGVLHKHDPAIGYGEGWALLMRRLDVTHLLGSGGTGSPWVGAGLLAVWAVAAVVAARRRQRDLTALHLVVGVAIALGVVDAASIMGIPWYYLSLWGYGTAALTVVAVVGTAARAVGDHLAARADADRWHRLSWVPTAALVAAIVVPLLPVVRDAPSTEIHEQKAFSAEFAEVIHPTVDAIEDGTVPGGPDGTLLVSWSDPVSLGGPGFSLVLELERRGYDVGTTEDHRLSVRDHRVVTADEADAEIHVAFGVGAVDVARTHPGAREIAFVDPRSDAEREQYMALRDQVIADLEAGGLDEAVPDVDQNMIALASRGDLPSSVAAPLYTMGRMPQPMAVLTWEPGS